MSEHHLPKGTDSTTKFYAELKAERDRLAAELEDWKQKAIHWDGMYKRERDVVDRLAAENAELQRVLEQIVVAHVRLIQVIDEHEQNDPESILEVSEARAALAKVKESA